MARLYRAKKYYAGKYVRARAGTGATKRQINRLINQHMEAVNRTQEYRIEKELIKLVGTKKAARLLGLG